ncbi:hypothetical protein FB45DRAFT_934325 [Roridomyces roridus]|uniref:Uncharacterized protein n=1 Tax=Roridomyces roridus TaxID=1738132 RepID=A0AAD7BCC2_9AGAR|nr:hypothetical protein FB45DRAFT_934325 [Roridomyces roridus]
MHTTLHFPTLDTSSRALPTVPQPSPPKTLSVPRRMLAVSGPSKSHVPVRRRTELPAAPRLRPLPHLPPPKSASPSTQSFHRPLPHAPRELGMPMASSSASASSSSLLAPYALQPRTRSTPDLRSTLDPEEDADSDHITSDTESEASTDTEAPYTPPFETDVAPPVPPKSILPSTTPSLIPPRFAVANGRKRDSTNRRAMASVRPAAKARDDDDDIVVWAQPQNSPPKVRRKRDSGHRGDSFEHPNRLSPGSVRYSRKWICEKGASRTIVREGEDNYADILRALRAL